MSFVSPTFGFRGLIAAFRLNALNSGVQFKHQSNILAQGNKMPVKTTQHNQFIVLIADDTGINYSSLKHRRQNIIVANIHNDILMHIETTQFDLILLDLAVNSPVTSVPNQLRHFGHPWQSELITRIKDPLCINNKTPLIAVIDPEEAPQIEQQCPMWFDDWLIKPITEERLDKTIALWQTKTSALQYIQIILSKTKNNQRLTLTIFEKLFEELPLQIIGIKNALDSNQYGLAQEITHKLNGSVSFCGLMDIREPANALESDLLNKNYANIHQHFLGMQQHILNLTRHREFILANLEQILVP